MHAHPRNLTHTATVMALVCHIPDRPNASTGTTTIDPTPRGGDLFLHRSQSPLIPIRCLSGTESINNDHSLIIALDYAFVPEPFGPAQLILEKMIKRATVR